tara:strand:+ start:99 stop:311 length:213 start_codon:yes stop_codon:yes gene_type:complete
MNVVAGHHASGNTLDLGLRVLGASDTQVGAEAFARVSGEIAEGLDVFADASMELNDKLSWQTTAGLKWSW